MLELAHYNISTKIYESDNSLVYRGYQIKDNKPFIFKVLKEDYPSPAELTRYKQEYQITRDLKSNGVIAAHALEKFKNTLVIILEDFGGTSLKILQEERLFSVKEWLLLALRITDKLGDIHAENVMHKDINPSNIVYNRETNELKIIDFGISTVLPRENMTLKSPNHLEGTLAYMSPEQTGRMNRSLDYRTDYYALGVTFYELLTGRLPFETDDPIELVHCHIAKAPIPPHHIDPTIPEVISSIILKLMKKTAEERYQSIWGIQADLQRCLEQLSLHTNIIPFKLAEKDISDRFQISQKLYGRQKEIDTLLYAVDSVASGTSELMLVAGYSGIGKSSLVQEIYKPITQKRGYFVSGKFDQFQRNIPYSAIVNAFRDLLRQLLTEGQEELQSWKEKLLKVCGSNGQVIIDVIPEMALIIGEQPPVQSLPPTEAQNRFNLLFQNFIQAFCTAEHPLVIFLDDLQWADMATLHLMTLMMSRTEYLLLIGAYRDNEVGSSHPLLKTLDDISENGTRINTITLSPLDTTYTSQFIADTCKTTVDHVRALAELVLEKTEGNPFFMTEFLKSLYSEGLLSFVAPHANEKGNYWAWDLAKIRARDITDNVVELMADKVQQLPTDTQNILKLAACIGNQFDLNTLCIVAQTNAALVSKRLWAAMEVGLIIPLGDDYKVIALDEQHTDLENISYKFAHDRIQQAVYSLIPEEETKTVHWQVGQLLLSNVPEDELDQSIFTIVDQLNVGLELAKTMTERLQLAELNLSAGKKAKLSTAYEPAFNYLINGLHLLPDSKWQSHYQLSLTLHEEATETAYLKGDFNKMAELAAITLDEAQDLLDQVTTYEIKIQACMSQHKQLEAVQTALIILKLLNIHFPDNPNQLDTYISLGMTKFSLAGKKIEDFIHLPEMTDQKTIAVMRILANIWAPAYQAVPKLMPLIVFKMLKLSLKYGNCENSTLAYAWYGLLLCGIVGDIETGHRFGKLALELLENYNIKSLKSRLYFVLNTFVRHWKEPVDETLAPSLEAYHCGLETGSFEFAAYAALVYCHHSFLVGKDLIKLEKEMPMYSEGLRQIKQEISLNYNETFRQAALNLRGYGSGEPFVLKSDFYDEDKMLPFYFKTNDRTAIFFLYINKLILCCHFHQYEEAMKNAEEAVKYLDGVISLLVVPQLYFYDSLARIGLLSQCDDKSLCKKQFKKITANQKKMKKWAHHAPMNYQHKYLLIEAERARLAKEDKKAHEYYQSAIRLAHQHEYLNIEGLAYELAAKFYAANNDDVNSKHHLHNAHYTYQCWGAIAKVKYLEEHYPELANSAENNTLMGTNHTIISHNRNSTLSHPLKTLSTKTTSNAPNNGSNVLDLASILKATQALTGEIMLDRLLENMMGILLENAGAQRGFLILDHDGQWVIEAKGVITDTENDIQVLQSLPLIVNNESHVPFTLINYVGHTKEDIVIQNALEEERFNRDPYVVKYKPKSILCSPLLNQGKLTGMLYVENNLTIGAFTPARLEVLQVLSTQAAISIENALLYKTLEQKVEERTSQLEQANTEITSLNQRLEADNHTLIEARQAAEDAAKSKAQFLANMSHEIRTPMNAVIGMTDLLLETELSSEQQDYVSTVQNSGESLLTLINDILDFSKIEAGKLDLESNDFTLMECVEASLELVANNAANKELNLVYSLDDNCPDVVVGDITRVRQIIVNLLSNAVKFTNKAQGSVTVSVRKLKCNEQYCELQFSVSDSGIGIPSDRINRLFKAFSQVSSSTTRQYGGTGLGLTICKRLSELMHGRIWVESTEGVGSTFHFTIKVESKEDKTYHYLKTPHPLLKGKRLLIRSTVTPIVENIEKYAQLWGMESCHFLDNTAIAEALERGERWDIAMIDNNTPEKENKEFLQKLIHSQQEKNTALILLTSLYRSHYKQFYFDECLVKPMRPVKLHKLLCNLLATEAEGLMASPDTYMTTQAKKSKKPSFSAAGSKILLAEDNVVNQKVATLVLKRFGCDIDIANNGLEVLAALQSKQYDLILMDIQMPEMDGLTATKEIRRIFTGKASPTIVAMTANAMQGDREMCIEAGMDDYLSKPIRHEELERVLLKYTQVSTQENIATPD